MKIQLCSNFFPISVILFEILSLYLKYIQILTTSHHLYCCHFCPKHNHLDYWKSLLIGFFVSILLYGLFSLQHPMWYCPNISLIIIPLGSNHSIAKLFDSRFSCNTDWEVSNQVIVWNSCCLTNIKWINVLNKWTSFKKGWFNSFLCWSKNGKNIQSNQKYTSSDMTWGSEMCYVSAAKRLRKRGPEQKWRL